MRELCSVKVIFHLNTSSKHGISYHCKTMFAISCTSLEGVVCVSETVREPPPPPPPPKKQQKKTVVFHCCKAATVKHHVNTSSTYLWVCDRGQSLLLQFLYRLLVIPKIEFGSHQNDGGVRTMVTNFRIPLHHTTSKQRKPNVNLTYASAISQSHVPWLARSQMKLD